ncbi:MAG: S24 family peptidase [Bacillota bacterium]
MTEEANTGHFVPLRKEVKALIKSRGVSVASLAEKMGIKRQALDFHINGDGRINPKMYIRIKQVLKQIEKEWRDKEPEDAACLKPVQAEAKVYPVLKSFEMINGWLDLQTAYISGYICFDYDKIEGCFAFINTGDQMQSESGISINNEDILFVDTTKKVITNDIALLKLQNDRLIVRQYIENHDGSITLKCLNNRYADAVIKAEDIKHTGRVCIIQPKAIKI